ncbi:hypothetical protein ANTRET_LOCUS9576 [Anthophora retusa]
MRFGSMESSKRSTHSRKSRRPATSPVEKVVDRKGLIFGECKRNSRKASKMYRDRFPQRKQPSEGTFRSTVKSLRENGRFPNGKRPTRNRPVTNDDNAVIALAHFNENPHTSIRTVAREMDMSIKSVHKILSNFKYHPYKFTTVQHLRATDAERRLEFIAWIIKFEEEPNILNNIMWTDESKFTNNGIFNRHNQHTWAVENPFNTRERNYQTKISINVWCEGGMQFEHVIK